MNINIDLIPFKKEELIPVDGKYFVRTESSFLKTVQHFQARCKVVWNEKKEQYENSVDVSNQTVTHISRVPI